MKRFLVKPGEKVNLNDFDPDGANGKDMTKDEAETDLAVLDRELSDLQERLWADQRHKVLVILQGMDTSGKDGTIRHVFGAVNPQTVKVTSFKKPTDDELAHDFLWRVHKAVPRNGEIGIFNRSHYEDVLIVRVHSLVPKKVWEARYDQINRFERMLADEETTILKFFLHIDKAEQKKRLEERLKDPQKQWKFNPQDLEERKLWGEYTKAYEDVLSKTSTPYAPWYVIPSNRKWFRNWAVSKILVTQLRELNPQFPKPSFDPQKIRVT